MWTGAFVRWHLLQLSGVRVRAPTVLRPFKFQLEMLVTRANEFPGLPELIRVGFCLLSSKEPSLVSTHRAEGCLLRGCCLSNRTLSKVPARGPGSQLWPTAVYSQILLWGRVVLHIVGWPWVLVANIPLKSCDNQKYLQKCQVCPGEQITPTGNH